MSHSTLFEYDTTLFADSVEAIPNSYCGFFISGTYQLDEATRIRHGSVTLHQLNSVDKSIQTLSTIDVPGVLDMKFNPENIGNNHSLAIALSDGTLSLVSLDLSKPIGNQWKEKERLLIDLESTICLSVDWSNQIIADPDPLIAVSLSNGEMSICGARESSLSVLHKWKAHTLPYVHTPAEVWITSFDPRDRNCLFSGGDDGLLKQWDVRMVDTCAQPVNVNREAEAGVTTMCWNKYRSDYITVGSYDGHVRVFDKRSLQHAVHDLDVQNNAGIWRIKYKHNCNYYLDQSRGVEHSLSETRDEMVLAAMRAGFIVMSSAETEEVKYLKQGGESLAYGVDYVYGMEEKEKNGLVASCSFYNHLMNVWEYQYCCVCSHHSSKGDKRAWYQCTSPICVDYT